MTDVPTNEQRFARCLEHVLRHEGGYADHPLDPGGATNLGITRKTLAAWRKVSPWWKLPKAEVKALGRAEAAAIYAAQYWTPVRGAVLPPGLDLALFDYAVNSGPGRAVRALQAVLKVKTDGRFGPVTLGALNAAAPGQLIDGLCAARMGFLRRLAGFATFGRGWSRRVADIRSASLAMAGVPETSLKPRTENMNMLAGYKTYIVAAMMLLAGIAGLLGVDIPALDGSAPGTLVMQALAFIFLRQGLKTDITNS